MVRAAAVWKPGIAGYVRAVDGASFEVGAGHAIAVGKRLRQVHPDEDYFSLNRPTAGEVVFDGTRLNACLVRVLARIGPK